MGNNLTPSKAFIMPTGVALSRPLTTLPEPPPFVNSVMDTVVSPVMLNPKILVPRFSIIVAASSAKVPSELQVLIPQVRPDSPQTNAGATIATTFPAVYHNRGIARPTFGQIFPRGLNGK